MSVEIHKIIRSKRKSIGLEITQDALLIVRAPRLASLKTIHKVVHEKTNWIKIKQQKLKKRFNETPIKKFKNGEKFLYLGKEYALEIGNTYKAPLILDQTLKLSKRYEKNAKDVLKNWYKRKACQKIGERVRFFYALTGLQYNQIKINSAKTRWGSCSTSGNLNFTWRLVMAPEAVIDYVVVHEMVHLEEKNHASQFWQKVEKIMPEYREHKTWLRENGHFLVL